MDIEQKLSVEQLLKPRYKVIADWPDNIFIVGKIYDVDEGDEGIYGTERINERFDTIVNPQRYQHLFKKLQWWEERKESDMPEYLCCICSDFIKFVKGQIISVKKHQSNTFNQYVPNLFISNEKQSHEAVTNCCSYKNFLPATESEYINQNKEK